MRHRVAQDLLAEFAAGSLETGALASVASIVVGMGSEQPARIRMVVPPRTAVQINGDGVGDQTVVPANTPQRIRVTVPDHEPWETELTLKPGEQRELKVMLQPKE